MIASRLASAVYEGQVWHRRHAPRVHAFSYRIAQLYLDLSELDEVFARRWFWSVEGRNLAEFRRSDYLEPSSQTLAEAVRNRVQGALGRRPQGPIRLLTHLRYAGYIFNPVSFYYCHQPGGDLDCIIAEITNTPWGERHSYVLCARSAQRRGTMLGFEFPKAFHVSPFLPMQCDYAWRFSVPGDRLRVHMEVRRDDRSEFDATLELRRRPLDGAALRAVLLRYPLMTLQVSAGIYWQALRLRLKGTPVHQHPVRTVKTL